jgi:hypothetical protein
LGKQNGDERRRGSKPTATAGAAIPSASVPWRLGQWLTAKLDDRMGVVVEPDMDWVGALIVAE